MNNNILKLKFYLASIFAPNTLKRDKTPLEKAGYELTFFDDFDGDELDFSKWRDTTLEGTRYYHSFPHMYFDPKCVEVKNGSLHLHAKYDPITTYPDAINRKYRIGYVQNDKVLSQSQGYYEIRCKVPKARGSWPAFWLLTPSIWPPEIDMFEFFQGHSVPRNMSYSLNWREGNTLNKKGGHNSQIWIKTLWDGWNVFGLEWDNTSIKMYVNGFLVDENTNPEAIKILSSYKWYVILDNFVQLNGNGKKGFDDNTFEIDYLKVYKKK